MLTGVINIGLGEILKTKRLIVPPNQRDYSWTKKEVLTLFQDLADAIREREEDYFLGTVVVVEKGDDAYEIVDGQQRLSTTAILLTAIRDYLATRNEDKSIANTITTEFITASSENMRDREPRIKMNLADNQYFIGILNSTPSGNELRESHELMRDAYYEATQHVKKIVSTYDPSKHGQVLVNWIKFIQYSAQVVLLTISSDGNAYRMFETLNDRGLKTTQADLVKNYLFGRAGNRLSEAQEKWASMRSTLETVEEDMAATVTFLRHALMLRHGYFRENTLHDWIEKTAKTSSEVAMLMDDFEHYASSYVTMFTPSSDYWSTYPLSHKASIATLNLFKIAGLRPLMLAVLLRFDSKEVILAYRAFANWSVRFVISGNTLTGGTIEVPLAMAAKKIMEGGIASYTELKGELLGILPTNEQFSLAFSTATVSKSALARYYLRSLERCAQDIKDPEFVPNEDSESVNLEHVLPEKPQANWPQFEPSDIKIFSKRIGNLALLKTKLNSSLRSAPFSEKRKTFQECPFLLTAQIGIEDDWTKELIIQRQSKLAELAVKTWPI